MWGAQAHQWSKCLANGATCYRCGRMGHFGRCCGQVDVQELGGEPQGHEKPQGHERQEGQYYYMGEKVVEICSEPWFIELKMCGTMVFFKIDIGADVSVIGAQLCHNLNLPVRPTERKLFGAGRHLIEVLETTTASLLHKNRKFQQEVFVVNGQQVSLLGRPMKTVEEVQEQGDGDNKYEKHLKSCVISKLSTTYNFRMTPNRTL
ncbi:hypothetical protein PR048_020427 [Dryococelus australis]|uniref:CCHC-type domain-containing protein n=1 Tax=Dryococelus australis TaxID=614101 RepID=A0ABQ9H698_9NEOP|nr:hypothetical protein PR048_020427 [Dryococelus australis]